METSGHYHCHVSAISRGQGRSVVASAAYHAGERHVNERTGLCHDFTRKFGVLHSEIMTPPGSPAWAHDRSALWNAAERAEEASTRRSTAKTGREFRLGLPHELPFEEQLACVRAFCGFLVETYGVAADFSLHAPDPHGDQRNFHAHVLTSTRVMTDAGFGGKVRVLDSPKTSGKHLDAIRAKWAEIENDAYARAGLPVRVDHRSFEDRGMDRGATVHLGPQASEMERRGVTSDLGDRNRAVRAENAQRDALKATRARVRAAVTAEETSGQRRADEQAERAAVRTNDPATILEAITAKRSTFSAAELGALLRRAIPEPGARDRLAAEILARPEIVALAEQPGRRATRYTTERVLRHEAEGLAAASELLADRTHAVDCTTMLRIAERAEFGSMAAEQYHAFVRCIGAEGLAVIAGEAGTGKSYTMSAIRQAYEAEGARVVGLAFTNKVTQDLKRDGFAEVRTIAGALQDVANGRAGWNGRTVLMVDEAAMLATRDMVALLAAVRQAGAKLILVGDERQLGSAYQRGGMFGAICARHGAAVSELTEIRRIRDAAPDAEGQRRAFNAMHEGRFREALGIFDTLGFIHWSDTRDEARAALAARYARDLGEQPGRRRFAFTHSNADALAVNAALRAVHRARGELGEDHRLPTVSGPAVFATGDRIQFTGSAYRKADREAGLANGMVGTVRAIDGVRVTVELDGQPGKRGRMVTFTVGDDAQAGEFNHFRHGYAGTVYKGQGATVDIAYRLHSGTERAATNYVGNTRHTDTLRLFTSREAVRGVQPWMAEPGGLAGLSAGQRESAERSYAAWLEAHPDYARRHGLADYVAYVQGRWTAEKAHAADLDQLARQMGRREEGRAASQFHPVERTADEAPTSPTPRRQPAKMTLARAEAPADPVAAQAEMRAAAAPFVRSIRQHGFVRDAQRGGLPWWSREAAPQTPEIREPQAVAHQPRDATPRRWQDYLTARQAEKSRDTRHGLDH